MNSMTRAQKEVMQLDKAVKDAKMFTPEHTARIKEIKQELTDIIEMFSYDEEETSYHEIMMYANAKAIMSLPEHQTNIFITRMLLFKSTDLMAKQLNVCRPTLTNYITEIKILIKLNANNIIKSFTD